MGWSQALPPSEYLLKKSWLSYKIIYCVFNLIKYNY